MFTTDIKYKPKINGKVQEYICRGIHFHIVYNFELVKKRCRSQAICWLGGEKHTFPPFVLKVCFFSRQLPNMLNALKF